METLRPLYTRMAILVTAFFFTSGIIHLSCQQSLMPGGIDQVMKGGFLLTPLAGPDILPAWGDSAQVKIGWAFDDPNNPQDSAPLAGWDLVVGDTLPIWSYDALRTAFGHPGQWHIRIPNLVNDNPVKNFWISWVYEFDTYLEGLRSATNIDWHPDSGNANSVYSEEWFDTDGNLTGDYLLAAYARITYSLDLHPNPAYEDVWLGLYGNNASALEVYIMTRCVAGKDTLPPEPPSYNPIGPSELPGWSDSAQVQLGWVFPDPLNPQNSDPLSGWDMIVGDVVPQWSFNAGREAFGYPAQWYARIPNLVNDNPVKNFWISWVYEFDPAITDIRSATNMDWTGTGSDNFVNSEEWFDANGDPTTDHLQATRARVTQSVDMFPNPPWEDVWLGVYGDTLDAREVYIMTRCVPADSVLPDSLIIQIDVKPGGDENPINPRSNGVIPVAILTTQDFSAADIDPASLRFGPAGAPVDKYAFEDVDHDGDKDMILHFRTNLTGISCGDSYVVLVGKTWEGIFVKGSDHIKTPGCH